MPKRASLALLITGTALALLLNFKTPAAPTAITIADAGTNTSNAASSTPGAPGATGSTGSAGSAATSAAGTGTAAATPTAATSTTAKSGTYTGSAVQTRYGNVQVQITVTSGKITDVQVLQYPSDNPHSSQINGYAVPALVSEALKAQSAQIDSVSGATYTSQGFTVSLQSALSQAGM
jgi:uncharacterized protein with FMN-binding domain